MKIFDLFIPIYNWKLKIIYNVEFESDRLELESILLGYNIDRSKITEALSDLNLNGKGVTISNYYSRDIITIFSMMTSNVQFWDIFPHELTHIIDHISSVHNIELEGRAYLCGFIYSTLYKVGIIDEIKPDKFKNDLGTSLTDKSVYVLTDLNIRSDFDGDINSLTIDDLDSIDFERCLYSNLTIYIGKLGEKEFKSKYKYNKEEIDNFINNFKNK